MLSVESETHEMKHPFIRVPVEVSKLTGENFNLPKFSGERFWKIFRLAKIDALPETVKPFQEIYRGEVEINIFPGRIYFSPGRNFSWLYFSEDFSGEVVAVSLRQRFVKNSLSCMKTRV